MTDDIAAPIKPSFSVLLTPGIGCEVKVSGSNLLPVPVETGEVWFNIMLLEDLYSIMHLEVLEMDRLLKVLKRKEGGFEDRFIIS